MTFRVGQKVVCIKASAWADVTWETAPTYRGIYTIRAINQGPDGIYLQFAEIVNPLLDYGTGVFECDFLASRFRPIVERKTEVSFTTGADPSTEQFDNRRKVKVLA